MKLKLKQGFPIGALLLALVLSPFASAATISFDNAGGVYFGDGDLVAIAVPSTNTLSYLATNGGGIGVSGGNNQVTAGQYIDIFFNQRILIDSASLAIWANPSLFGLIINDRVQFSYPVNIDPASPVRTTCSAATNCSLSSSVATFGLGGLAVDAIRIANPQTGGWTIQRINYRETPVPATLWLFGSALLGLGLIRRRKA